MRIWFYLFLVVFVGFVFLTVNVILIKKEIKNMTHSLTTIINTDTNKLMTVITPDKDLKKLTGVLNHSLKELREL